MNLEIFTYVVIVCISGVLSSLLAIYAFVKRNVFSGSKLFILMSCFSAIYVFGHAFELSSSSLVEIKFWLKVQYAGLPFITPTCLVLILQFAGLDRFIKPKIMIPVFLVPLITFLMSVTNDFHHLFYRSVYLRPNESVPLADITAGPWYLVHGSYTFATMVLGTFILLWYWIQTRTAYWKQILTLILGQVIPMTASFLYLIGLSPMGMDPVPIVMCLTSTLYFWAIFSAKLFMLAPIARNRIFESMRDGVLVIDEVSRIVDFNQGARGMIEKLKFAAIGEKLDSVWSDWASFDPLPENREIEWCNKGKYYQIRITDVRKKNNEIAGKTIVLSDVTEKKKLEQQLKLLAYTDGLTKAHNRTYFLEKSQQELNRAINKVTSLSLFLFDIDFFKKINDGYGHSIGDLALCHIVDLCKSCLAPEYIFARYGGEEFVVCLPDVDLNRAGEIAETIRAEIEANPLETEKGAIPITSSFGVAEVTNEIQTLDALLQEADKALYASKENGRNRVTLAAHVANFLQLN
ncbi:diguanylate cyclase [Neobacillus sp. YIM B02564]|uniref:Diguanylate cyclase n=1 Tax=Neobacillus paridis TaxID=2803862 RepID=A0ABS1TP21_9BACI|nr:histidine kinase N-terminal 7TM domain-containing protein [Neobacillus paridis]MBL4951660.1 diguanylate cyclase [Neobacillus paridis]